MPKTEIPQITVLMTVYNGGNYLKPTVQSVLNQTFKDFEFLIIDDCSKDNSLEIIRSFGDARIRIHKNETNVGQTRSLNVGLRLAAGSYVARIDADDVAFSRWLETQLSFIEHHPQNTVVSASAVIIDHEGRVKRLLKSLSSPEDILLKTLTSTPINHVGSLMHKDAVLESGGYNENFRVAADYELWSRLLVRGLVLTSTGEALTAIRVHGLSVSRQEKDSAAFREVSSIIEKNFHELAKYTITEQEARLIAGLDYQIESLNGDDLGRIKALLEGAYNNMQSQFSLPRSLVQSRLREAVKVTYIKKIFASIEGDNLDETRSVARHYVAEEGIWNFPFLLLLSSYIGKFFMKGIIYIYEKFSLFLATVKLCRHKFFLPNPVS